MYMNDKNFVIKRSEVYQRRGVLDITFLLLFILPLGGCWRHHQPVKYAARIAHQEACAAVVQGARSRRSCSEALRIIAPFVRSDMVCAGMQGALLFALGYGARAEEAYRNALPLVGGVGLRCQLWNDYACLLAQRGKLGAAVACWRRLLGEPMYGAPEVVWLNIAQALRARRRYGLAVYALRCASRCIIKY